MCGIKGLLRLEEYGLRRLTDKMHVLYPYNENMPPLLYVCRHPDQRKDVES
jgi:hypothetical protein